MRRPSRLVSLLVTGLATGALVLTGCSKDESKPSGEGSSEPNVEDGGTIAATWPLTGLPVEGDESAEQPRPVLVTKIDNTSSSSPQVGLGSADLVVEELVEGGLTRLAVFYYSQLPEVAGPVRSMRASDIGIVSPAGAAVVTSGAAAETLARVEKAGVTYFQEGAEGIYRAGDRSAPYNVLANLRTIARTAKGEPARPADYLPWAAPDDASGDLPPGRRATTINAGFSGGHTTTWVFRQGGYVNTNTYAAADDQFPADSVLVLRVQVGDAGYLDPAGNPVPETEFAGEGAALLFHGGRMVRGTWAKEGLDAPVTLSTKAGALPMPPGRTWIELVPAPGGDPRFSNGTVTFK